MELKAVDLAGNESSVLAIEFKIENRALPQMEQKITPKPLPQEKTTIKPFKKPELKKTFSETVKQDRGEEQPVKTEENARGEITPVEKEESKPLSDEKSEIKKATTTPSVKPPKFPPKPIEPQSRPEISVQPLFETLKIGAVQKIKNNIKNVGNKLTDSIKNLVIGLANTADGSGKKAADLAQGAAKSLGAATVKSAKAVAGFFREAGNNITVAGTKVTRSITGAAVKRISRVSIRTVDIVAGFFGKAAENIAVAGAKVSGSITKTATGAVANIARSVKGTAGAIRRIRNSASELKLAMEDYFSPLEIYDLQANAISSTAVEIVWQTNHKATSKVNYGLTRVYNKEKQDSKKVKSHSVILTKLLPATTYHYEVLSQNGSYAFDADRIFITSE